MSEWLEWGVADMTELSAIQIIPPSNTGRARAVSGEVRDLVPANARGAGAFAFRPMFANSGDPARPTVSAPFLAQHLDQEWIQRDSAADSRGAAKAYADAAPAPAPRHDLAPPA